MRKILFSILAFLTWVGAIDADARTIHVSPNSEIRTAQPQRMPPTPGQVESLAQPAIDLVTLQSAIASATAGDRIVLGSGTYNQKDNADRLWIKVRGTKGAPIVITGENALTSGNTHTVIDGFGLARFDFEKLTNDHRDKNFLAYVIPPTKRDSGCIGIEQAAYVIIENLELFNCGDKGFGIVDSHHITIRNSVVTGGQYVVTAEGPKTHHVLVEGVKWKGDVDEIMWNKNHWCEMKIGKRRKDNGAFFAATDIAGGVILRRNEISHAFNAVRTDISSSSRGKNWLRGKLNANFEIYENKFSYIRDNVIEPEFDAVNWWIRNNIIENAHAWFSFDGLHGGRYYIHNNHGYFNSSPSTQCDGRCQDWRVEYPKYCGDLHDGGRVYKFRRRHETPNDMGLPGPVYAFNNSWYLRIRVAKQGVIRNFKHWNNAIEYCRSGDIPGDICSPTDEGKSFFANFLPWRPGYEFRSDLSNHPEFPNGLVDQGYQVAGVSIPWPGKVFNNPSAGDFSFANPETQRLTGCKVIFFEWGEARCESDGGSGPQLGAGNKNHIGPTSRQSGGVANPYVHLNTRKYKEDPRVVSMSWPPESFAGKRSRVTIVFSVAVKSNSPGMQIMQDDGSTVNADVCQIERNKFICEFDSADFNGTKNPTAVRVGRMIKSMSGRDATLWGRYRDNISLY